MSTDHVHGPCAQHVIHTLTHNSLQGKGCCYPLLSNKEAIERNNLVRITATSRGIFYLLIHSLIHSVTIKYLPCAKHCPRSQPAVLW